MVQNNIIGKIKVQAERNILHSEAVRVKSKVKSENLKAFERKDIG